jgi:hypothetical protein
VLRDIGPTPLEFSVEFSQRITGDCGSVLKLLGIHLTDARNFACN